MAGPALLSNMTPDITAKRAENPTPPPGPKDTGAPERESAFERARRDAAKAEPPSAPGRDDSESRPEPAQAGNTGNSTASQPGAAEEDRLPENGKAAGSTPATAAKESELKKPDETAFTLALPIGDNVPVSGKGLPQAAARGEAPKGKSTSSPTAGPVDTSELQQLFIQKNRVAGTPDTEAVKLAAADAKPGELDLKSFKASLAEAIDPRGGSTTETAPASPLSASRGLELKDGAALLKHYSTSVDTPVQQGDWGDKIAGKINWLANQRISFAEIHLNPADLGPVEVRVHVQNDQASVVMHAQHASVRDLLELNGNRLRDMMQDSGLNLTKMDVSDQPAQQQQAGERGSGQGGSSGRGERDPAGLVSLEGEPIATGAIHLQWTSQVDTYV